MLGGLLGGAVGDALGAPIEFMSLDEIRDAFGPDGLTSCAPAYGRIGVITDDTQVNPLDGRGPPPRRKPHAGPGHVQSRRRDPPRLLPLASHPGLSKDGERTRSRASSFRSSKAATSSSRSRRTSLQFFSREVRSTPSPTRRGSWKVVNSFSYQTLPSIRSNSLTSSARALSTSRGSRRDSTTSKRATARPADSRTSPSDSAKRRSPRARTVRGTRSSSAGRDSACD
jgi:hypothetical protein